MGIVINQATWGDETSATDITSDLQKQASGGYLNTTANESLVPAIDLALGSKTSVALSEAERSAIGSEATKTCGGGADQKCIDYQTNQLETVKLKEKLQTQQSSANIVKGRRLTLTYTDTATGLQKTVAIPDGQQVKFGTPPTIGLPTLPTFSGAVLTGFSTAFTLAATVLYVFSVAVTWRTLKLGGFTPLPTWILTILAVVVPYSGILITPVALAIVNRMAAQKLAATV